METSSAEFFVDADDRIINRDGLVAVLMQVRGQTRGDQTAFRFKPAPLAQSIEIQWDADSDYQVFPREVASGMVRKGYAAYAPEDMLKQVNADMAGDNPAQQEDEAEKTAPKKRGGRPRKVKTNGEA